MTHRHGLAAVQCVDRRHSLRVATELDKSTACRQRTADHYDISVVRRLRGSGLIGGFFEVGAIVINLRIRMFDFDFRTASVNCI